MLESVTCKFNLPVYEKKETTFGDCDHVCMMDARCTHYFWNSIINIFVIVLVFLYLNFSNILLMLFEIINNIY